MPSSAQPGVRFGVPRLLERFRRPSRLAAPSGSPAPRAPGVRERDARLVGRGTPVIGWCARAPSTSMGCARSRRSPLPGETRCSPVSRRDPPTRCSRCGPNRGDGGRWSRAGRPGALRGSRLRRLPGPDGLRRPELIRPAGCAGREQRRDRRRRPRLRPRDRAPGARRRGRDSPTRCARSRSG